MKPPIVFKTVDLIIQAIVISYGLYTVCGSTNAGLAFDFINGYVAVGSVQLLSCLINKVALKRPFRSNTRIGYELLLIVVAIAAGISFSISFNGFYMFLLWFSPVMALWYLLITGAELRKVHNASSGWRDNNDIDVRADA